MLFVVIIVIIAKVDVVKFQEEAFRLRNDDCRLLSLACCCLNQRISEKITFCFPPVEIHLPRYNHGKSMDEAAV